MDIDLVKPLCASSCTGPIPLDSAHVVGYCTFVLKIPPMLDADLLFRYESEDLEFDDIVTLFQQIYDTKAYTWLQGSYGRMLRHLIEEGLIAR